MTIADSNTLEVSIAMTESSFSNPKWKYATKLSYGGHSTCFMLNMINHATYEINRFVIRWNGTNGV